MLELENSERCTMEEYSGVDAKVLELPSRGVV